MRKEGESLHAANALEENASIHKEENLLAAKVLDGNAHAGLYGRGTNIGNRLSVTGLRTQALLESRGIHDHGLCPLHKPYLGFRNIDLDLY